MGGMPTRARREARRGSSGALLSNGRMEVFVRQSGRNSFEEIVENAGRRSAKFNIEYGIGRITTAID
jgi:hypothetical protein